MTGVGGVGAPVNPNSNATLSGVSVAGVPDFPPPEASEGVELTGLCATSLRWV